MPKLHQLQTQGRPRFDEKLTIEKESLAIRRVTVKARRDICRKCRKPLRDLGQEYNVCSACLDKEMSRLREEELRIQAHLQFSRSVKAAKNHNLFQRALKSLKAKKRKVKKEKIPIARRMHEKIAKANRKVNKKTNEIPDDINLADNFEL